MVGVRAFCCGSTVIAVDGGVRSAAANANGDIFDLPYEITDPDGRVVERGVFENCYVKHVDIGIAGDAMEVEPVDAFLDRTLPFKAD